MGTQDAARSGTLKALLDQRLLRDAQALLRQSEKDPELRETLKAVAPCALHLSIDGPDGGDWAYLVNLDDVRPLLPGALQGNGLPRYRMAMDDVTAYDLLLHNIDPREAYGEGMVEIISEEKDGSIEPWVALRLRELAAQLLGWS